MVFIECSERHLSHPSMQGRGKPLLTAGAKKRLIMLHRRPASLLATLLYFVVRFGTNTVFDKEIRLCCEGPSDMPSAQRHATALRVDDFAAQAPLPCAAPAVPNPSSCAHLVGTAPSTRNMTARLRARLNFRVLWADGFRCCPRPRRSDDLQDDDGSALLSTPLRA